MHQKLTLEEEQGVVNLYLSTGSLRIVRLKFKTSLEVVKKILEENNIPVSMRKQPLNIEYFKEIDSPEKAYWLGFIAADGCLHKSKYKLSFCMKDSDILFKFKRAIGAGSPVRHRFIFDKRTEKTYEQYSLQINSKEFCQYICNHGVDQNKSKTFLFPKIKEEYYSHFVRGMFDGDGWITMIRKKYRAGFLTSKECAEFLKKYLEETKFWTTEKIGCCKNNSSYNVFFLNFGKSSFNFLSWLYEFSTEETRLDRKYNKFIKNKSAFENEKREIINEITGEKFEVWNISSFCRERNLNPVILDYTSKGRKPAKIGRHAGWRLLPKRPPINTYS